MTSKISFSNLVRSEIKKMYWLLAVQALVFGLLMPFKVVMYLVIRSNEIMKYQYDWDLQKIFGEVCGFNQPENTFFILAAGIVCALTAFAYVYAPAKLDFYHSLAIKRPTMFVVKLISSAMTFVIPYVICQVLTLLAGAVYGVVSSAIIVEICMDTLAGILYFMCSYSGTLLAIMLTGKMITTFFALVVLAGYFPFLYTLVLGMKSLFMPNCLNSIDYLNQEILAHSSPWMFCMYYNQETYGLRRGFTGYWPQISRLCQVAAIFVILILISVWLYSRRRTEAAGSALAFPKTEEIIKILLTVPAAIGAAMISYEIMDSVFWMVVFIVLFGTLACLIMEFIYRMDIQQVLSHKSHIVITILLASGIILSARSGMMYYNSYVPDADEIQCMSVKDSYTRIQYDTGEGYPKMYQYELNPEILDYFETENFDRIYEVAKEGASVSGNIYDYENLMRIGVKYKLKNGKELYRSYWADREKYLNVMDELLKDPQYKEKIFPILTWGEEQVKTMSANIWMPEEQTHQLYEMVEQYSKGSEMKESYLDLMSGSIASDDLWNIIQAYRKDLEGMSYSKFLNSAGELNFHWDEQNQCYYGDYPLNIEFEHTMEVLAEIFAP